ncbi:MAG: hypothetical protein H0U82_03075 [Actinobacteria bacterium]|nr:hypothetical protein [Actinomycetota bacterium]
MADVDSQLTSTEDEKYLADRRRRRHRGRLVGFLVCVALWVLSVVPLARESIDGREGAAVVAVYLAVAGLSLGVAAVIRGIYALLRKQRFWSPWVFLIAALLAVAGYAIQSAGEEVVPIPGALGGVESQVADSGRVASGGMAAPE